MKELRNIILKAQHGDKNILKCLYDIREAQQLHDDIVKDGKAITINKNVMVACAKAKLKLKQYNYLGWVVSK